MTREIELKLKVADADAMRDRLRRCGARFVRRTFEINRIFDTRDGALRGGGCGFRVRQSADEGRPEGPALVTFKGPREAGELKIREEIETTVGDVQAFTAILERIGLVEVVLYEKRRELWKLADCALALDELPRLGWWLEIEGPTEPAVLSARDRLELTDAPPVRESYVQFAARAGRPDAGGRTILVFDIG